MTWTVAARAKDTHESTVKPKSQSAENPRGYVYVPAEWKGKRVLCLLAVSDVDVTTTDHVLVTCTAQDFNRNTPSTKGEGAALSIPSRYVGTKCIVLLHPTSIALEHTGDNDA